MFVDAEKIQQGKRGIKSSGFDLLEVSFIRKLFLWNGFPFIFQLAMLFFLIVMIIVGWGIFPPAENSSRLFARLNLITLLVWGIWWPMMIAVIILFGRIWCMICPLELISRLSLGAGNYFRTTVIQAGSFIRNGGAILLFYFIIQMLVSGIGLHSVPAHTALFFTVLIGLAVFSGLFYKNGSFCKYFCPVAMTLNAYSRGGMLAVRTATKKKCSHCPDKSCIKNENTSFLKPRSCPCSIYPPKLENNNACMMCGQCIKSCTSDNIQLLLRHPFDSSDRREKPVSVFLSAFVFIESGFIAGELAEELPAAEKIFMLAPRLFTDLSGLQSISGWVSSIWTMVVFPLIFWSLLLIPVRLRSRNISLLNLWHSLSMRIIILAAGGHLLKSLLKFSEWVTFLPYALADPSGKGSIEAIETGRMLMPKPLLSQHLITITALLIIALALYYFRREKKFYAAST